MAKKFKFPDPNDYPPKSPAVLCPADRVLNLYNQANQAEAKRISKKVREWFYDESHQKGWKGIHFMPEVQSQHGAGCLLWSEQKTVPAGVDAVTFTLIDSIEE